MIDLIRSAHQEMPDHPALIWAGGVLTYADLEARAEALARGLLARNLSRVACVVTDQAALIPLLAATSWAGCEACTYAPLLPNSGIDELAAAFGHTVVITDRQLELSGAEPILLADLPDVAGPAPLTEPVASPLLVLTTGTTARPKAARHEWGRLARSARLRRGDKSERWLLAYNLNQFAGLQVLLHVLASGATLVVPESNQPRDALRAMLEHSVTHVSATPTFWRFLVALLDDPAATGVPDLVQVTMGGEASSAQVLADVRRLFPRARISQIYASTEFGSGISVADGRPGLPVTVLDRPDGSDVQFRIVDGQLEARSQVGMLSYLDEDQHPVWRPTGDLVEVRGDRIVFVGRASETINVGGVKVHPLSVEDAVASVPGVRLARAYGRQNPVSGQIVALDVVADPGADTDQMEEAIRLACAGLPPAAQPRRVRFVEELEIREQKIARTAPQISTAGG